MRWCTLLHICVAILPFEDSTAAGNAPGAIALPLYVLSGRVMLSLLLLGGDSEMMAQELSMVHLSDALTLGLTLVRLKMTLLGATFRQE